MSDKIADRSILLRAFVFLVAFLVIMGWLLSWVGKLDWLGLAAVVGLVILVVLVRRWAKPGANLVKCLCKPFSFWPFALVGVLSLVAALSYPPAMSDSLEYRIPRILMWLQENQIYHAVCLDNRLNFMPQNWELVTLPLIQLAGIKLIFFWNFVSWLALGLICYNWAVGVSGDESVAQKMAFISSTSTFAVLQSGSSASDLFAATLALLSLYFVTEFERTRDWREINWSVLSFCLAAGTKPQFVVLGLPLVLWFIAAPSKPWRAFQWSWFPLWMVAWLVCSPIQCWILNHMSYGSWFGPGGVPLPGKSHFWNGLLGTIMLLWQAIQPPVNPLALVYNAPLERAVAVSGLKTLVPLFALKTSIVNMVLTASLGLVMSSLLVVGIILAVKRNPKIWKLWQGWAVVAGMVGLEVALSQGVPRCVGRICCGFLFFSIPLAMVGWNLLKPRMLRIGVGLCLCSSLVSLIVDRDRPLWPAHFVQRVVAESPRFNTLEHLLDLYLLNSANAQTGKEIVEAVPAGEKAIAALVASPELSLFYPYSSKRKLLLMPPNSTVGELESLQVNYVIVDGRSASQYPALYHYLEQSGDYELVLSHDYVRFAHEEVPQLKVDTWKLYRRKAGPSDDAGNHR